MNEKKAGGLTSRQKREIRNNLIGYSFIIPNLVGYSIFVFIPVIFSFVLSVMKWDGFQAPMEFVGLANFVEIFGDRVFRGSFVHTVQYAVMTVPFTLVLSLLLAVLLNSKIKGVAIFRTAFYFPYIASIVAVGAVWNMLFQPDFGPVNEMLKAIGIAEPPRWVVSTDWAMVAVSIVSIWKYMGYYMIVYLAALQGISSSLYEAAQIRRSQWLAETVVYYDSNADPNHILRIDYAYHSVLQGIRPGIRYDWRRSWKCNQDAGKLHLRKGIYRMGIRSGKCGSHYSVRSCAGYYLNPVQR